MLDETRPSVAEVPPTQHRRFLRFAVLALIAVYSTYFSLYTCITHARLETWAFDLGTFDQGIWLAGHSTNWFVTVRGLHLLGDHVRLFSFVLAPLYWVWDDVRALLVLQSVVIAAGAWFLLRVAEQAVPRHRWFALALCASWLLHPGVQNLNLDHAHPDAFASTLLIASVCFLRRERMLAFWIAALLAMSCKEDVPLVFVAMGFVLMFDRPRRRLGSTLLAVSGGYFALCMLAILPYFNGLGFFRFDEHQFLAGVGAHAGEPSWIYERLFRQESATYLWLLGAPLLFLFVLAPLTVVPAIPSLVANLLSDVEYMRGFVFHYQTWVLPFLYIGTIDAFALLVRIGQAPGGQARRALRIAARFVPVSLVIAAVAANVEWATVPVHRAGEIVERWRFLQSDPEIARVESILARIPPDASVSADYALVPQLAHRQLIYMFPNPFRISNWGLADENADDPEKVEYIVARALPGEPIEKTINRLLDTKSYRLIEGDENFGLYRRIDRVLLSNRASCGDWDGDGVVTLEDVHAIADAIMNHRDCPPDVCDVDGDGRTAYVDVLGVGKRVRNPSYPLTCPPAAAH